MTNIDIKELSDKLFYFSHKIWTVQLCVTILSILLPQSHAHLTNGTLNQQAAPAQESNSLIFTSEHAQTISELSSCLAAIASLLEQPLL